MSILSPFAPHPNDDDAYVDRFEGFDRGDAGRSRQQDYDDFVADCEADAELMALINAD